MKFDSLLKVIQGWVKIKGDSDGTLIGNTGDALKVTGSLETISGPDSQFYLEVAKGLVSGHSIVHKFGSNFEIDNNDTEDIWTQGGLYPFPSSAQTTTIRSDDNSDTAAGTGARTVRVFGLDANYNAIQEDITLNGTSSVTLSNQYLRCFRAFVLTAGSQGVNDGDIEIRHGSTVICQIAEGKGQTLMAIYTIPAGKTGYLVNWKAELQPRLGSTATRSGELSLLTREEDGAINVKDEAILNSEGAPLDSKRIGYLKLLEKTDVWVRATASNSNTAVTSRFEIILVDNA